MSVLDKVQLPKDIKKMNNSELDELCADIRELLVETVSETGGHLASNLGVVELSVALHKVFNSPTDQIVFDGTQGDCTGDGRLWPALFGMQ